MKLVRRIRHGTKFTENPDLFTIDFDMTDDEVNEMMRSLIHMKNLQDYKLRLSAKHCMCCNHTNYVPGLQAELLVQN